MRIASASVGTEITVLGLGARRRSSGIVLIADAIWATLRIFDGVTNIETVGGDITNGTIDLLVFLPLL